MGLTETPTLPLQRTLRPDPISRIQETYLGSFESQLVATAVLFAVVVLGLAASVRVRRRLSREYGTAPAEAGWIVVLGAIVVVGVYGFSVVWHVTYVLEEALGVVRFDRWTVAEYLVSAAVLITAYLAIRFVNRSIDTLAQRNAITNHQSEVAYHVADVAIGAGAATVVLTIWGFDLTNVFIGAGAITAVVALTARETLAAMLAGFILLFSRPFYVGDWVEINETTGIVTDVTIFTTKIQTFGDRHVLVPNDEVTSSQVTNYSRNDQLRVDVEVGVDYDTDVAHARSVVADAVEELESIKGAPNPQVITTSFGDSAILLECRVWIGDPTMRRKLDAKTDVIEAIADAFEREGISIPYPQRTHATRADEFRIDGPDSGREEIPTVED